MNFITLSSADPLIMKEWDHEKNIFALSELSTISSKKVWWKCELGHSWETSPNKRFNHNRGCAVCKNKKVLPGFNDLATLSPSVAKEWNYDKNYLQPTEVTPGSNKKVWWKCPKGHSFEAQVYRKVKNPNLCSVCRNRTVIEGVNNLNHTHPNICSFWDYVKNSLKPEEVTAGSHMKVWWKCDKNHEWQASIVKVSSETTKCPYCSNKKVLLGYNDLATTHPFLVQEWDHSKNTKSPQDIVAGSDYLSSWICSRNKYHKWSAYTYARTGPKFSGCPFCSASLNSSNGEKEIAELLTKWGLSFISSDKTTLKPLELDLYIFEKNIAIEFNGLYWHSEMAGKTRNYHYDKWKACKEQGIQLIQIWEDDWKHKQEIVLKTLQNVLNISSQPKIGARNTIIKTNIDKKTAQNFLEKNHIQGSVNNSTFYCLTDKDNEILALLGFRLEKNTLNITRYATSKKVQGGFSKLLDHVINNTQFTINKIVTFSDNTYSSGKLYKNLGFVEEKILQPDFYYFKNNKKYHKSKFRIKNFKNSDDLEYEENKSEKELAELNKISRIWDAGKIKWVKYIN